MTASTAFITERRERTFLVLAGIFLSAMTLLNVVGITRFIQFGPLALAVGVLPYPLTFLCTDLISELYGKARANFLVSVGLGINLLILGVLTLGAVAPSVPEAVMPPWQVLQLAAPVTLPNGTVVESEIGLFQLIYATTSGAVLPRCWPISPHNTVTCSSTTSGSGSLGANTCGSEITSARS